MNTEIIKAFLATCLSLVFIWIFFEFLNLCSFVYYLATKKEHQRFISPFLDILLYIRICAALFALVFLIWALSNYISIIL